MRWPWLLFNLGFVLAGLLLTSRRIHDWLCPTGDSAGGYPSVQLVFLSVSALTLLVAVLFMIRLLKERR